MNKLKRMSFLILGVCLIFSCQNQPENTDQSSEDEVSAQPDRNMFGMHIPRGLTITSDRLTDGYVMFCAPNSPLIYLINRKGEVVHQWKANYGAFNPYLQDDGSIVLGAADQDYPVFDNTGPYGRIEKVTWDGKTKWDFEYATEEYILHHDIAVLPSGNILAIAYEVKPFKEAIARGGKPEMIAKDGSWLEKIIEIEPQDKRHGKIVWEWHLWDHLIQDYDETKSNYGDPGDHPELLDFNTARPLPPYISEDSLEILLAKGMVHRNTTIGNRGAGLFHFNAINYNEALDQIVFSSPPLSEIFIIDHSTTTEEAAGHSGGRYGKGGDFLYRWGNPQNYQRGDSTNQQLFGQHDIRWVEAGKPGAGNLTLFNNDVPMGPDSLDYSAIFEFVPPITDSGNYILEDDKSFGPEGLVWIYTAQDTLSFYSSFISSAHRMENGNTFINEGAKGRFFEVTPEGETVWEYLNQYRGEIRKPNGDPIPMIPFAYVEFRSTFIPADHPSLAGKELKPLDPQPEVFKIPPPPLPGNENETD